MSFFQYQKDSSQGVRSKIKYFSLLVVLLFICLGVRIWYLQIINGQYFQELSENNRTRMVSLPGFRGWIKDRNGNAIVNIRPSFNLYITPEDTRDLDQVLNLLSSKIDFKKEKVKANFKKAKRFHNVLIKADIQREEVAFVMENSLRLAGAHIKAVPLRNYVFQDFASQTLGYLGEISKLKLRQSKDPNYKQGDMIGKNGLESIFETELRGTKGYKEVEVDVSGRELQTIRQLPPKSGNHLVLTIDTRLQKTVEKLMAGTPETPINGSVVVLDPQSGEILALASKPSFDPNLFSAGISRDNWRKLIKDPMHPLQNKAIDGQYPPGSTYKIVTAYAGLSEKLITPDTSIHCPGYFKLGKGRYRCWKKEGHGPMNLHKALVQSCDVYFYTLGNRLGIDKLALYAKNLGLGQPTKIRLKGEKPGLIPSTDWKLLARGKPWLLGETISASIGQGYNLVTPLQQANLIAGIANGGTLYRPYLIKKIEDPDGKMVKEFGPSVLHKANLSPKYLEMIRKSLLGVVHEPHGTGWRARLKNVKISGKTGTAQVVSMKKGDEEEEEETPYVFRDHAWFVAFAPFENPKIAIAIIVEHGGHGGAAAAPIAKEIVKSYFKYYPQEETKIAS
jgi:penicillin-binding protein 2